VSLLRETVRLRDESARSRTTTSPGHQGAVSVLHANVHQEQHRQTAHRAGAQSRAQPEGFPAVQPFGLGHCASVTMSSASLSFSPSPPRSPSRSARGGTGSNNLGDHLARAGHETGPRLERTRREERLQLGTFVLPFVVVSERRPGSSSRERSLRMRAWNRREIVTRSTTIKIRTGEETQKRHGTTMRTAPRARSRKRCESQS